MKENSSIWIDASIDKIWQAITDEQQLSQWYAPGSTWKIPSLVAGEKIIFTLMPNAHNGLTEKLPIILTIKNIIQNQEFSFFLDVEETLIAILLEEAQKGTTVAINMSGYEPSLANLKALVEGN
ncbi:SRPBCC family protein [Lysinibacillus pakistanensis]|uniref:SRPBCC domain-containing protein n=1 Tax=Lysinibacillus pakistanensis TaxID=759811 RepID=A0AAX3X381_9BACI|nr:SRPBCC domain-containing protein [Lysinibacillus pakistanensis]MDM5233287.1 SRPBCC domain-containing protein [Lysinibacillus pakistanensis]WHY48765.1 SRPBCC domain-containing protein [Lysinibacillus pakistanensis]WHY53777.1 SRPBCC domain-containing protein [Lysinibacillus pakistanensis]